MIVGISNYLLRWYCFLLLLYAISRQKSTICCDRANIKNGVDVCKRFGAQAIVAIGGGSIIDASKAIGIIMTNPEFSDVRSLEGLAETKNKSLPIIAVSTTAGTAAEVTINYVITDVEKKRKFVCVDPHDIPVVAIVDPDMSASMPKGLCASTGMDALVHAIEGYITKGAWELTDMLHIKAIELIAKSLRKSVDGDYDAREEMSLAQYIAGMGFSNVGLGIVHSMAHPLSALYDVPHGKACAMMLTAVLKYNASATGNKYKEIARAFGVQNLEQMSKAEADSAAIAAIQQLADDVNIPKHLKAVGVKEEDLEFLAKSAMEDACTPGNPKDPTLKDIISIYKSIM
ncbi:iron-containing alcohol dehydrogenase [Veillonella parvula]|uniref:iron-containing alcohol dehydrogenase n=1 Tax=Veillonella parvula TaxID=29466 RepID=UPI0022DF3B42|nr:iron-containing alcohol dehydrogenase [Veillonella parvula]